MEAIPADRSGTSWQIGLFRAPDCEGLMAFLLPCMIGELNEMVPTPIEHSRRESPFFVLVVDDYEFRRQWTKRALTGGPYKVRAVSSAHQGLQYLRQVRFDAVVIGEHLRGMGSRQLASALREKYPEIPVIVNPFPWPIGRNARAISPGAYHCLILCTQDKEAALLRMVEEALGNSSGEGTNPTRLSAGKQAAQ
jgi:DNA-binding NtrC family response regulator